MAAGSRYSRWAVYAGFVATGTLLNFLAMPLLRMTAIRALRRSPRLRGIGLARFAVIAGWWVIVIEIFVYLLFSGMLQWMGN
jgi:hypothetical protein